MGRGCKMRREGKIEEAPGGRKRPSFRFMVQKGDEEERGRGGGRGRGETDLCQ